MADIHITLASNSHHHVELIQFPIRLVLVRAVAKVGQDPPLAPLALQYVA